MKTGSKMEKNIANAIMDRDLRVGYWKRKRAVKG